MSPISPMPQLRVEGMENSGTRIPALRDPGCERLMTCRPGAMRVPQPAPSPSSMQKAKASLEGVGEDRRLRQEADDDKGLVGKVEEIARMNQDAFRREQFQH